MHQAFVCLTDFTDRIVTRQAQADFLSISICKGEVVGLVVQRFEADE